MVFDMAKNGHQNDIDDARIGLCAQNIYTLLGLVVNTFGRAYVIT